MSRARGPWELPRSLLIGGHAAFLGQAYEAAPLRRAVRLWLAPCRSRAGSFRFDRPSGLRCGALPEAAMVRLSSVAWACPLFSPDTPLPRWVTLPTIACPPG